jgi:hypothetical protein
MSEYRVKAEVYEEELRGLSGASKIADIVITLYASSTVEATLHSKTLFAAPYYMDLATIEVEKT